jgi:hypothetical protein
MSTILKWILPYIITAANNYLPDVLEMLIKKIVKKDDKMGQIVLNVKSLTGVIAGATAAFNLNVNGTQTKISDATGIASISGLAAGTYPVTVSANGYTTSDNITITLSADDSVVNQDVVLQSTQTVQVAVANAQTEVVAAAADVITAAVTTTNCTTLADAKTAYKALDASITASKAAATAAMKSGATEIVQAEGAELTKTLKQQLTDSIGWYVKQRSELGTTKEIIGDFKKLGEWCDYSSMIGSMCFLRSKLVSFVEKVVTWAISHA